MIKLALIGGILGVIGIGGFSLLNAFQAIVLTGFALIMLAVMISLLATVLEFAARWNAQSNQTPQTSENFSRIGQFSDNLG